MKIKCQKQKKKKMCMFIEKKKLVNNEGQNVNNKNKF